MGRRPIPPHFSPPVGTIGTTPGEVNAPGADFPCDDNHLPAKAHTALRSRIAAESAAYVNELLLYVRSRSRRPAHGLRKLRAASRFTGARKKWESAGKPGSVVGNHSSGMHVAVHLERPTREPARAARCGRGKPRPRVPLFGLAPGGVCRAMPVTRHAVRSYRTLSPLPAAGGPAASAVCFLLHFPWTRAPQALPGALPSGARTFLPRRAGCIAAL
jgi:hypothetical protein